ncbi:hypothetical protein A9264_09605 [Vibrio sp. UCD-FRSSP16_10]|uniref:hypothetical protein n=1 Tax=unclassified Vibrio TaxID=2614977 RepID=UPI0007FF8D24|nr:MULTISPECIES: hypothetical protein [unclassified Vibrio]OBT16973.1 hypothetical protein A9260_09830 [Vibrio sp. UCD-FRSSP16_30]OBT21964.1 hypothetical protein A9264_09605 [Vibrio sp. UCD-FRSSP16_10]
MLTVTEIMAAGGVIILFMVLFLGIGKWISSRSEKSEYRRLQAKEKVRATEAQRVRLQKEKVVLADNGHLTTQIELAKINESKYPKEAVYWYEKAALQESREGIEGLIRVCDSSSEELLSQDSLRYWKNALDALNGDEQAEYEQGIALFEGFGIQSNMDRGLALIEHAANRRCLRAQMFLVDWYRSTENPLADEEKAQMWRQMSDTNHSK